MPVAILLEVEIKPEHVDEFLAIMNADTVGSRQEKGCVHFDLMRVKDKENTFVTYEVFANDEAIAAHKEMEYVKNWGAFQYGEKKPVVNKRAVISEVIDLTEASKAAAAPPTAIVLEVEIKPEHVDEFLAIMNADTVGSRQEKGCVHFDLMRVKDKENTFVTYEVFANDEAIGAHKEMEYVKNWGAFQYGEAKPVVNKRVMICEVLDFA